MRGVERRTKTLKGESITGQDSLTRPVLAVEGVRGSVKIDEKNFPDENFRNYLLRQTYGSDGVLTNDEIKNVTSMNVSSLNIQSLDGIQYFAALKELDCGKNGLTSLDVSENGALEWLDCYSNQLTTLDVSKNTLLTTLYCHRNELGSLDISKNAELMYVKREFDIRKSLKKL